MIEKILTAAGVKNRRARFTSPPAGTYAVFFDDLDSVGADPVHLSTPRGLPRIRHHEARVELYEPKPDDVTEANFEAELDASGVDWTKEDRYWLQDVRLYQVLYTISYTTK